MAGCSIDSMKTAGMSKGGCSLSKLCAGRKRESGVWKYFTYDAVNNKSVCMVKSTQKEGFVASNCGLRLAGKNPTNLKVRSIICLLKPHVPTG
jgi:hypothetical protein